MADLAKQRKIVFVAASSSPTRSSGENGNPYTFRLRASTYMQTAMLVPEAAKLGKKRWAIVYPNYEYGQAAAAAFKKQMIALQPGGIEFIEQAVPLGKIEPGPVVQALQDAKPDAIFSALFGPDLSALRARGATARSFPKDRPVFNLLGGEPEYLDPLKDEAPVGWWVTGYPWYAHRHAGAQALPRSYQKAFSDYPRLGSVVGYSTVMAAAAAIRKAGSTDSEKIAAALNNLTIETPFGPVTFRGIDHQSTSWVPSSGRTAIKDGKGVMVDWRYAQRQGLPPFRRRKRAAFALRRATSA